MARKAYALGTTSLAVLRLALARESSRFMDDIAQAAEERNFDAVKRASFNFEECQRLQEVLQSSAVDINYE